MYFDHNSEYLGDGFIYFLFSPEKPGQMIQFDLRIYSKWVGSTTN